LALRTDRVGPALLETASVENEDTIGAADLGGNLATLEARLRGDLEGLEEAGGLFGAELDADLDHAVVSVTDPQPALRLLAAREKLKRGYRVPTLRSRPLPEPVIFSVPRY
jgi:hypothetical protein